LRTLELGPSNPFAPAEDRATLASDPSADGSPANGSSGAPHPRTARASPCRCRNKSDKCICLSPHQIALTIDSTATIINPRTTGLNVVNHWQFCHTPTLPLATLYNCLNFPESIAINYHGPSHNGGPFPESKEAIAGYWFIQADSLADAVEIAKGNPCLEYGETVEVRPILPEHSTLRMAQEQICPLNQK